MNIIQYGIASVLHNIGIAVHAENIARHILISSKPCIIQNIALDACRALSNDPESMIDLAIINRLDQNHRFESIALFGIIFSSRANTDSRLKAAKKLLHGMAASAKLAGDNNSEAAAYYSLGNISRSAGSHLEAVTAYNRARKLRSDYGTRDYFMLELAGLLYLSKRYRISAKIYEKSVTVGQKTIDDIRLGDALLMSGQASKAVGVYKFALTGADEFWASNVAAIYVWLSERIVSRYGDLVPTNTIEAQNRLRFIVGSSKVKIQQFFQIIQEVDGYCEVANFNLGIYFASQLKYECALENFLICTMREPSDVEAWSNAIKCAWNISDSEMTIQVLNSAIQLCGMEAYQKFRADLVGQFELDEQLGALDEMVRSFKQKPNDMPFLLRIWTDDGMATLKI